MAIEIQSGNKLHHNMTYAYYLILAYNSL